MLPLSQTGRAILSTLSNYPDGLSRYGLTQAIDQFADKSVMRMVLILKAQGFVEGQMDIEGATRFRITAAGLDRLATSPPPRLNPIERDHWTPQSWQHPYQRIKKRPKPLAIEAWPADPTTMKHPVYPPRKIPPKPLDLLEIPDATP